MGYRIAVAAFMLAAAKAAYGSIYSALQQQYKQGK
jgi:hypothetical protein